MLRWRPACLRADRIFDRLRCAASAGVGARPSTPRASRSARSKTGLPDGAILGCRSLLGGHPGTAAVGRLKCAVADDGAAAFGGEDTPVGDETTAGHERSVGVQGAGGSCPACSPGQRVALMGHREGEVRIYAARLSEVVPQVGAVDIQLGSLSGRGRSSAGRG
jgi:hypothetical protein